MRYCLRSLTEQVLAPVGNGMQFIHDIGTHRLNPIAKTSFGRHRAAALESVIRLIKPYPKLTFDYGHIELNGKLVEIEETVAVRKPFCNLLHFSHAQTRNAPKVLLVAAMSGHHATLSKETLREFLPDHDVYITDWLDARLVPLRDGRFGFEEYVQYLIEFLEALGPNVHLVGLCQAGVPALCAAALMSADKNPARPRTLALLAAPMDIRVKPNAVTRHVGRITAKMMSINIHTVPAQYPGAGRKVYPGYVQLMGFVSLKLRMHINKHIQFFRDVANGDHESAQKHRTFYDEYNAMMDSTAEFYLETLERVFFDQHLPKGCMQYHGKNVDCAAITDIPLLTLEGEDDDMVAIGVTEAAQGMCPNLQPEDREHHVQAGVGHYGIFNGSIYKAQIAPRMKAFMQRHGQARG